MSYTATSLRKMNADARAQVWPCTQAAKFFVVTLAAGGSQVIEVQDTPFVAHRDWLLGAFNVLSFAIKKDQFSGAVRVEIDYGTGAFSQAFVFPLTGQGVVDTLTGFELGGLAARFYFVNGVDGTTNANGWLQLRSW